MLRHRIQTRLGFIALSVALLLITVAVGARAESVLRVAMTAGDVPITIGQPDQGFEGYRFVGYNLYDALILWDLSRADVVADLRPGLATSGAIDPANPRRWIIEIHQGVKWHDGCDFKANDVVWNLARIADEKAPRFRTDLSRSRRHPPGAGLGPDAQHAAAGDLHQPAGRGLTGGDDFYYLDVLQLAKRQLARRHGRTPMSARETLHV